MGPTPPPPPLLAIASVGDHVTAIKGVERLRDRERVESLSLSQGGGRVYPIKTSAENSVVVRIGFDADQGSGI